MFILQVLYLSCEKKLLKNNHISGTFLVVSDKQADGPPDGKRSPSHTCHTEGVTDIIPTLLDY